MIHKRLLPIDIIERAERLDRGESEESILFDEEMHWHEERDLEDQQRLSITEAARMAFVIDVITLGIWMLVSAFIR